MTPRLAAAPWINRLRSNPSDARAVCVAQSATRSPKALDNLSRNRFNWSREEGANLTGHNPDRPEDMHPAMSQKAVLIVCLGNICRSPMAEVALRAEAVAQGLALTIDSAGTSGMHTGEGADPRAIAEARRHGIDLTRHRARGVTEDDFLHFGHIYAADHQNLRDLQRFAPRRSLAKLSLLLDLVPGRTGTAVLDPYYGDADDFAQTWADVTLAAKHVVASLMR